MLGLDRDDAKRLLGLGLAWVWHDEYEVVALWSSGANRSAGGKEYLLSGAESGNQIQNIPRPYSVKSRRKPMSHTLLSRSDVGDLQ